MINQLISGQLNRPLLQDLEEDVSRLFVLLQLVTDLRLDSHWQRWEIGRVSVEWICRFAFGPFSSSNQSLITINSYLG